MSRVGPLQVTGLPLVEGGKAEIVDDKSVLVSAGLCPSVFFRELVLALTV